MSGLGTLLLLACFSSEPPALQVPVQAHAQVGPTCLAASAATVLSAFGEEATARGIARQLPVYPDGSGFFALQEELRRRGYASLVLTGGPAVVVASLRAGLPVIAALKGSGGQKHAVTVFGVDPAAQRLEFVDPAGGQRQSLNYRAFAQRQMAAQLLIAWPAAGPQPQRLRATGFPWNEARATNARFRAESRLRQAAAHEGVNAQVLYLLREAVREDPSWAEAQTLLERAERAETAD